MRDEGDEMVQLAKVVELLKPLILNLQNRFRIGEKLIIIILWKGMDAFPGSKDFDQVQVNNIITR